MHLSTSVKVGAGLLVTLLLLLVVATSALLSARTMSRSAKLVEHTLDVESDIDDLENAMLAAESATRGFLLTGDERFLDSYRSSPALVTEELRELRRKTAGNSIEERHLDVLEPLLAEKLARMNHSVSLLRTEGPGPVIAEMRSGVGRRLMARIRAHLRGMTLEEERLAAERNEAEIAGARRAERLILLTAMIAGVFVVIASILIHRDLLGRRRAEDALRNLSMVDELTGLYNRRGFLIHAEDRIRLSARLRSSQVLVFADLDGLKAINDLHGHAAGDEAISAAATLLRSSFRDTDIVARLGGDEFAVLAMMDQREDAEIPIRTLRAQIDRWNAASGSPFRLSLSLGSTPFDPGTSLDGLLAAADRKMYQEKQERRARRQSDPEGISARG